MSKCDKGRLSNLENTYRTGTKEMLVRNSFSAYELGLQETVIDFLQEQNEVMKNHLDKLVIGKIGTPDPYSLVDGLCNALFHLPDTLYNNVQDCLMKHDAGKAFKNGNSLFKSRHLSGIKTHNSDINVRYSFVRDCCHPEQRISNANYDVWVCLHKDSGEITNAGCTHVAGYYHLKLYLAIINFIKTFSQNSWHLFEVSSSEDNI